MRDKAIALLEDRADSGTCMNGAACAEIAALLLGPSEAEIEAAIERHIRSMPASQYLPGRYGDARRAYRGGVEWALAWEPKEDRDA